jgi:hypothetical protein
MVTKDDAWTRIEGILIRVGANEKAIEEVKNNIRDNFVRKDVYEPLRNIVYGLVGAILLAVIGALMKLVIGS